MLSFNGLTKMHRPHRLAKNRDRDLPIVTVDSFGLVFPATANLDSIVNRKSDKTSLLEMTSALKDVW